MVMRPLLICNCLSVRCEKTVYATLVIGQRYHLLTAEDGRQESDFWSGFIKVKAEPSLEQFFSST